MGRGCRHSQHLCGRRRGWGGGEEEEEGGGGGGGRRRGGGKEDESQFDVFSIVDCNNNVIINNINIIIIINRNININIVNRNIIIIDWSIININNNNNIVGLGKHRLQSPRNGDLEDNLMLDLSATPLVSTDDKGRV